MFKKKIQFLLLAIWAILAQNVQAQSPCSLDVNIAPPASISCQNPSVQLQATVTPPGGNYAIDWYGPVSLPGVLNPVVTTPGAYALFVYDSLNQCWAGDTVYVMQDGTIPQCTIAISNINCNGNLNLSASAFPQGTYTYQWSTNQTTQSIDVNTSGTYCVTVTNTSGCSAASCFTIAIPDPLDVNLIDYNSFFCGDSTVIHGIPTGGVQPFSYLWSDGSTSGTIFDPAPGTYIVTITDGLGCTASASFVVEDDVDECVQLQGKVFADWNTNCAVDASDEGINGVAIRVENVSGDEFYTYTNPDGSYQMEVYPGTYTITVLAPNALWEACQSTVTLTLNPNQTVSQDFLLKPLASCPAMTVDLGNPWLRRCFTGHYYISYCNQGTAEASDAFVEVMFDPLLTPTTASVPFTAIGNNVYRFDLGDVPFNTCGTFWVNVYVACEAELGQTVCAEAVIHPVGNCEPADAQWSGASIDINAQCLGDSIDFEVKNVGTGNMPGPLDYVIIEDAVMLMQAPPPSISTGRRRVVPRKSTRQRLYLAAGSEAGAVPSRQFPTQPFRGRMRQYRSVQHGFCQSVPDGRQRSVGGHRLHGNPRFLRSERQTRIPGGLQGSTLHRARHRPGVPDPFSEHRHRYGIYRGDPRRTFTLARPGFGETRRKQPLV
ncbi:MAG: carboxypeptidase regulatory-like domain-containing protein [Lewinellaceae bacterium]|nr:carboxypeptidase regulatory-like domain-containing protein [Lewinellaceae bacterium]